MDEKRHNDGGGLKHLLDYQRQPSLPRRVPFWWHFVYDPLFVKWWILLFLAACVLFLVYVAFALSVWP
jgi:hypothetical protein